MKDQTTITARIPNDLSGDLATLAGALQRPRSWVSDAYSLD
jgi:predicted transcriptional regulator